MNIYTNSCICNWITWCLLLVQSCISQISSAVDVRVRINPVFFLQGVPFLVGDNWRSIAFILQFYLLAQSIADSCDFYFNYVIIIMVIMSGSSSSCSTRSASINSRSSILQMLLGVGEDFIVFVVRRHGWLFLMRR